MTSISSNTILVNVNAPARTVTQYRPVTHVQPAPKPQPVVRNTNIVQVAHRDNEVRDVTVANTITRPQPEPDQVETTNYNSGGVVETSSSLNTSNSFSIVV